MKIKRLGFLILPHPLTNFELETYYQNEPRFNGVFSINNLPNKIKDGAYIINLDEYADVGIHWIALFCNKNEIVYFDSFGVATSSGVSIISFTSIVEAPVGIVSEGFFSLTTGIVKKLLNITRNKKKKHDKILMLAKSKLNSIETLISQALIDMEISHEEYITILEEKDKYERTKDNLRSDDENLWDWVVWNQRFKWKTLWVMFKCNEFINNTCK